MIKRGERHNSTEGKALENSSVHLKPCLHVWREINFEKHEGQISQLRRAHNAITDLNCLRSSTLECGHHVRYSCFETSSMRVINRPSSTFVLDNCTLLCALDIRLIGQILDCAVV